MSRVRCVSLPREWAVPKTFGDFRVVACIEYEACAVHRAQKVSAQCFPHPGSRVSGPHLRWQSRNLHPSQEHVIGASLEPRPSRLFLNARKER